MSREVDADRLRRLVNQRWHRLYLDTAVLNDIGRGNLDVPFVESLIEATAAHAVVLVISAAHFRDALKPNDPNAPYRLAATIERFPFRALVDVDPFSIEPWTAGPADIDLLPWGNVRETLTHPAANDFLVKQDDIQGITFDADEAYKKYQRALRDSLGEASLPKLSNPHQAIVVGATNLLALGMRPDAAAAIDRAAEMIHADLTPQQRARLVESVVPFESAVRAMAPLFDKLTEFQRLDAWPIMKAGPEVAPGAWLVKQLVANRTRNIDRDPERSDVVDLEHSMHFPYVDIATCDRQAFAALQPILGQARGSRSPHLFRNGEVQKVLAYMRTLPTFDEVSGDEEAKTK